MNSFKMTLIALASTLVVAQAANEGEVRFHSFNANFSVNAPIYLDTLPAGPHPNTGAGTLANPGTEVFIYWGSAGSTDVGSFTRAKASGVDIKNLTQSGGLQGYMGDFTAVIDGTSAGSTIAIALFATDGSREGFSNAFDVTLGGTPVVGTPITTPDMIGLQAWAITTPVIPEPSTIALGVVGGLLFMVRRRRS